MKPNNIIEINGQRYDAKTGMPVGGKKKTGKNPVGSASKFVDGFRPQSGKKPVRSIVAAPKPDAQSTVPAKPRVTRAASPNVHPTVKRSVTLNRSAVKRPTKAVTPAQRSKPAVESAGLKAADTSRLARAASVAKSSAISRFHIGDSIAPANEVKAPKTAAALSHKSAEATPKHQGTKERLINQALSNATAHEHAHKKHKTRHFGRYITTAAVTLLLVAYVAYLNVPSISMKVAAHRAGFAATMPGYRPSGYSLSGPIAYSSGQVVVGFRSNTDDRQFSLKQQPTNWDSTALVENYVVKQSPNYLTYQDRGLTIYIFGGSSAAWVNAGKLYNLDGKNSELDTDQVLKLATSV